ncbi:MULTISPECIES: prepilin peptidase [Halomonas]|uniref:prepilin peptidase n=1 Tax=Halomonas TaxID=2745 RepID=UPI001E4BC324|nr:MULTISPECIES: A24 family peptidase [Halomonas]
MLFSDVTFASLALVALLGLCLGSFLNVIITRLPVMLMQQWRTEARAALELSDDIEEPLSLARPRSRCPRCLTPIAWHDNLPLLGWLKRRGRCANCQGRISIQYPLVELASALLAVCFCILHGPTWPALWLYGASLTLLALAVIDLRTQLLPDALTLPLLWCGLLYQLLFNPASLDDAVIGATAGYAVLWAIGKAFHVLTGRDGMGLGDVKLIAALGAWLGWQLLPLVILIAALLGAISGLLIQWRSRHLKGQPLPFGPSLVLAGGLGLLAGNELLTGYQALSGLT